MSTNFYEQSPRAAREAIVSKVLSQGATLFFIDITNPCMTLLNPSRHEQCIRELAHASMWAFYHPFKRYENIDILMRFYDDYPITKTNVHRLFNYEELGLSISEMNGVCLLNDMHSEFYTVINNNRMTTDTPEQYDNTIHIFGHCHAVSLLTEDRLTVASQLQRLLNAEPVGGRIFRVKNRANSQDVGRSIDQMLLPRYRFKAGDIVLLINGSLMELEAQMPVFDGVRYFDFNHVFNRPHDKGELFFDLAHTNHRGYSLVAGELHRMLKESVVPESYRVENSTSVQSKKTAESRSPVPEGLQGYLRLLQKIKTAEAIPAGAVVMNCNPFTLGHLHLVEKALEQCEFLYVFIVEEDKSDFSFYDRFSMARAALAGIERLRLLPSGKFIVSAATLPEYFIKAQAKDITVDATLDIIMFAEYIAPALNITKRFFGQEPFCPVTHQYKEEMKEHLPEYGIDVMVIPRLEADGVCISASGVRRLLRSEQADRDHLLRLLPASTLRYIEAHCQLLSG